MASSSARQPRGYQQDYIARIRYSNALPPPSMPPKLLEIPNQGLRQYLTPNFTARIAREQPVNIEADGELGMPLDLVGMPGIFDGDETYVQAPEQSPIPHPNDKPLLRSLTTMTKSGTPLSNVSFLRRTEHISVDQKGGKNDAGASPFLRGGRSGARPRRRPDPDRNRETPSYILKTIIKGFDIAHPESAYRGPDTAENVQGHDPTPEELRAWNNPQHPTKKGVHLVDSFPLVPDFEALPDTGGYIAVKFATNPVAASDTYDERLDFGILRPLELRPELQAAIQAAAAAHSSDPSKPPPGPPPFDYEYFIPQDHTSVRNIRRKLNPHDPRRDDADLYTNENKETSARSFRYERIRAYETVTVSGSITRRWDELAITMYEPSGVNGVANGGADHDTPSRKRKAAYYYPILQKSHIRPRRTTIVQAVMPNAMRSADDAEEQIDYLDVVVRDPDEAESAKRAQLRADYDPLATAPSTQPNLVRDRDRDPATPDGTNGEAHDEPAEPDRAAIEQAAS